MQEEGEFEDLFTGKKIELKDVELAAHGICVGGEKKIRINRKICRKSTK